MKRMPLLLALMFASAAPLFAQTTRSEVGFIVGGSRRFVENNRTPVNAIDDAFSFSNTSFELFYSVPLDESTNVKVKIGRIDGSVGFATGANGTQRTDTEGEIQHIDAIVDYRFSEVFGTTGIFGGPGLYRQTASGFDSDTGWGLQVGVNADFPITRRYGLVTEASYHWTHLETRPRYLTIGAGLRIGF